MNPKFKTEGEKKDEDKVKQGTNPESLTSAMWLLFHVLLSTSVVLLAMPAIW